MRVTITPQRPGDLVNSTYRATRKKWVDRCMSCWVRSHFILPRLSCSSYVTQCAAWWRWCRIPNAGATALSVGQLSCHMNSFLSVFCNDTVSLLRLYSVGDRCIKFDDTERGKSKYSEKKICFDVTLSTTYPTWAGRGSNHSLRGKGLQTKRRSHGTVILQTHLQNGKSYSPMWT